MVAMLRIHNTCVPDRNRSRKNSPVQFPPNEYYQNPILPVHLFINPLWPNCPISPSFLSLVSGHAAITQQINHPSNPRRLRIKLNSTCNQNVLCLICATFTFPPTSHPHSNDPNPIVEEMKHNRRLTFVTNWWSHSASEFPTNAHSQSRSSLLLRFVSSYSADGFPFNECR